MLNALNFFSRKILIPRGKFDILERLFCYEASEAKKKHFFPLSTIEIL